MEILLFDKNGNACGTTNVPEDVVDAANKVEHYIKNSGQDVIICGIGLRPYPASTQT